MKPHVLQCSTKSHGVCIEESTLAVTYNRSVVVVSTLRFFLKKTSLVVQQTVQWTVHFVLFFTAAAVEKPPLQIVLAAAACRVIRLLSAQSSDVESQRILAQLTGPSLLTFTSPIVQS